MPKSSINKNLDAQELPQQEIQKTTETTPVVGVTETKIETAEITPSAIQTETKPVTETTQPKTTPVAAKTTMWDKPAKDKDLLEIENILSEDIGEAYSKLSPQKKKEFKVEGEKAAYLIWQMVETAKIQVSKAIDLIRRWLKMLPGINKFFLEQEIKLKADKIISLAKKHGAERNATNK